MRISVLVSARKNSKFLAKFIFGYLRNTQDHQNTELLIMVNKDDTWNQELIEYFNHRHRGGGTIRIYTEDWGMGRAGLHEYFNKLAKSATGDALVYFCEDHFINYRGWDTQVRRLAASNFNSPNDPWIITGKFDNIAGPMNQVFSRGYYETLGYLGRNGWIDSYVNAVVDLLPRDCWVEMPVPLFHDFTHDKPQVLDDSYTKTEIKVEFPAYDSDQTREWIAEDAAKIKAKLEGQV